MTNKDYAKTIFSISLELSDLGIPNTVKECWDGYKISYPWCEGTIAMYSGIYGFADGCVESYKFPWDEGDVSVLRPTTAIKFIQRYWLETLDTIGE